jgi:hypothetical protein
MTGMRSWIGDMTPLALVVVVIEQVANGWLLASNQASQRTAKTSGLASVRQN